jgi:hypothetical protein
MKKAFIPLCIILVSGIFTPALSFGQNCVFTDTLYVPGKDDPPPGAMYPRVICLEHQLSEGNNTLLSTFEHYINGMRSFPIYRSTDNGKSWSLLSRIEDTYNRHGNKYQPFLFELPRKVGENPAGTILCAGNSIPRDDGSTELTLYRSPDGGKTWEFMSSIVKGGRAIYNPKLNESPVWEPFLYLDKSDNLVCYYSDEQSKAQKYNQLLCHKVSADGGLSWGDAVLDVAISDNVTRPGMPVVCRLPDGRYFMIYEVVGLPDVPVYFRYSDDGLNWGNYKELGTKITDEKGNFMSGTPYAIWIPQGGSNGTLIASAKSVNINGQAVGNGFMINHNLGEGHWTFVPTAITYDPKPHSGGYSQAMTPMNNGKFLCHIVPVPFQGNKSMLLYSVYEINMLIKRD